MFLAVVRPPNNAETALMEMKHKLYIETGAVSVWALRPMIPFAFFSGDLPEIERKQLPGIPVDGIKADEPFILGDQFCLSSEGCRDFCESLSGLFRARPDFSNGFPGVHLFDSTEPDGELAERMINRSIQLAEGLPESVFNWRSCRLEIYKTNPGILFETGWWKRVILETVLELSFPSAQPH